MNEVITCLIVGFGIGFMSNFLFFPASIVFDLKCKNCACKRCNNTPKIEI